MRNISFNMTTDQVIQRQKAVTRRFGWDNLKPDEHLRGVNKCRGLKPGEHPVPLAEIIVLSSQWEPVRAIIDRPVRKAKTAREWRAFHAFCKPPLYPGYCLNSRNGNCTFKDCNGLRETYLEGFPLMTPEDFATMLIKSHKGATLDTMVNRISFEYARVVKPCTLTK